MSAARLKLLPLKTVTLMSWKLVNIHCYARVRSLIYQPLFGISKHAVASLSFVNGCINSRNNARIEYLLIISN